MTDQTKPALYALTPAQHATVLAALSHYRKAFAYFGEPPAHVYNLASDCGSVEPLNPGEIDALCDDLNHTGLAEPSTDLSALSTTQLTTELRSRGLPTIVWLPGDMEGYGDPIVPLEDRLEECRKSLEDQCVEAGWAVIDTILGKSPDDGDEDEPQFVNHYRHCGQEWSDTWSCMCNDRCPVCNKEIEPYDSEEVTEGA